MSNSYKIYRWDSFLYKKNIVPMIYIKPDDALLKFADKNKNELLVKVSNSNSIYNGKTIAGVLYKSFEITKCINFFKKTGLYVIVLVSNWYGYPDSLGECDIFGFEGDVAVDENTLIPLPDQMFDSSNSSNSSNSSKSLNSLNSEKQKSLIENNSILILLLVILLVYIIIIYKYKDK